MARATTAKNMVMVSGIAFDADVWGELPTAILKGDHDADLYRIEQAIAKRREIKVKVDAGIRVGVKVSVAVDKRSGEFSGREGIVRRVNKVRATVVFACSACGSTTDKQFSANVCQTCFGIPEEAGIPFDLLTVKS